MNTFLENHHPEEKELDFIPCEDCPLNCPKSSDCPNCPMSGHPGDGYDQFKNEYENF